MKRAVFRTAGRTGRGGGATVIVDRGMAFAANLGQIPRPLR
jgi:hypothetical protein